MLDVEGITNSHPINLLTILNYVSFIIFIILSLSLTINKINFKSAFGILSDLSLILLGRIVQATCTSGAHREKQMNYEQTKAVSAAKGRLTNLSPIGTVSTRTTVRMATK